MWKYISRKMKWLIQFTIHPFSYYLWNLWNPPRPIICSMLMKEEIGKLLKYANEDKR